jgi:hypothetical protein
MAEDAVSPPACSDGVCVINVLSKALIVAPCTDDSVLVAYSQTSGATLLQCSDPSDPQDNRIFVYYRKDAAAKSYEFRGGRFIRPGYLATAVTEGIPDRFGAVPLCAVKDRRNAATGELLLAEKQPSDSQGAPYCFRIHSVVAGKGTLQVLGDDGKELAALPPVGIAVWAKLRENVSPYVELKSSALSSSKTHLAVVSSVEARLFEAPSLEKPTQMYLVNGDLVEIVDDSKLASGWCRVRYVNKSGMTIEAWMQTQDLDLPK